MKKYGLTEWDEEKEAINLRKHGVSFLEAATVLNDPLYVSIEDHEHSENERRFRATGLSSEGRVLVLAYTYRDNSMYRLISARIAAHRERRFYEES
jgi:uncharacterized DUF497 family protein